MKGYLEQILPLLDEAEEARPAVKQAIEILKSYGPDLRDLFDGIFDYSIDRRIRSIKKLQASGFTREDAINITMDEWYATVRNVRKQQATRT